MVIFKDLSYYSHQHYENARNIGWCISDEHVGKNTNVDKDLIRNLWDYIKRPVNKTRDAMLIEAVEYSDEKLNLGFAEIRVIDKNGERYAAPDLLFYYIVNGIYTPPQCFIDAVINGPKPGTKIYEEYFDRYKKETLWGEERGVVEASSQLTSLVRNDDIEGLFASFGRNRGDINVITEEGSLLNTAIIAKKTSVAKYLVEAGININKFSGSELNSAIDNNENEVVEILLSKGIFINVALMSTNPLFKAIVQNNTEAVKLLLNHDIDINISYTNEFVRNITALDMAKKYNNPEILKLLGI
ncbi:ankyrin repeat domain-containing protein [Listeria sp. FSL L7-1582]|uniref:ankyrin repeat domain-containing protein n=1 Tax=Listeria portnoyi TaxID=2713504 RepID=UPI00164D359E|nr:ankyrin repeat domain-containing protein [Listeria portnoyi]MBC6309916.1 ankyrin repeat domain-containing protein [Listeria portnoyi]